MSSLNPWSWSGLIIPTHLKFDFIKLYIYIYSELDINIKQWLYWINIILTTEWIYKDLANINLIQRLIYQDLICLFVTVLFIDLLVCDCSIYSFACLWPTIFYLIWLVIRAHFRVQLMGNNFLCERVMLCKIS